MNQNGEKEEAIETIATNRKAHHLFFIEETYEAGIVLVGTEVKSLRDKRVDLSDSFARLENEEMILYNAHISPYTHGNLSNHDPLRKRKLLLKKREIWKIFGKVQQKGLTIIPLKLYFKKGLAKVELAIARGKKLYDKRATAAKKTAEREIERTIKKC